MPSEEIAITEADLEFMKQIELYESLPDSEQKEILARVLGSKKVFAGKKTTKNAIEKGYMKMFNRILDDSSTVCPICYQDIEALSWLTHNKGLEVSPKWGKVIHIKTAHTSLWDLLRGLFETGRPELKPNRFSPNPENCSNSDMSTEELTRQIQINPELRRRIFHKWKSEKETKNRNQ